MCSWNVRSPAHFDNSLLFLIPCRWTNWRSWFEEDANNNSKELRPGLLLLHQVSIQITILVQNFFVWQLMKECTVWQLFLITIDRLEEAMCNNLNWFQEFNSREVQTSAGEPLVRAMSSCPIQPSPSTICPCPCHPLIIDEIKHTLYHSPLHVLAFAEHASNKLVHKPEFQ